LLVHFNGYKRTRYNGLRRARITLDDRSLRLNGVSSRLIGVSGRLIRVSGRLIGVNYNSSVVNSRVVIVVSLIRLSNVNLISRDIGSLITSVIVLDYGLYSDIIRYNRSYYCFSLYRLIRV
jgi:hypothetical protein